MIKEIKLKNNSILLVKVPSDVKWYCFTNNNIGSFISNHSSIGKRFLQYGTTSMMFGIEVYNKSYIDPKTFYCCQDYEEATIIGKITELTDEKCREFVDIDSNTPKESFISLLQYNGVDINDEYLIIKINI